jgi:transcription antitermination protein NusB
MTTRRRAREVVLQVLFEDDLNPTRKLANADEFLVRRLRDHAALVQFARDLVAGIRKNRPQIDLLLGQNAANWSVKRMAVIDRNVLRMATYEMIFGGTPGRVAINEAIELAKRYGNRNSGQFVNGILDRVLKESSGTEPKSEPDKEPASA